MHTHTHIHTVTCTHRWRHAQKHLDTQAVINANHKQLRHVVGLHLAETDVRSLTSHFCLFKQNQKIYKKLNSDQIFNLNIAAQLTRNKLCYTFSLMCYSLRNTGAPF